MVKKKSTPNKPSKEVSLTKAFKKTADRQKSASTKESTVLSGIKKHAPKKKPAILRGVKKNIPRNKKSHQNVSSQDLNKNLEDRIFVGANFTQNRKYQKAEYLLLRYSNRHGLVTGATGTGKTVTLQVLAQAFSELGVPVFCTDIKGDLSGISVANTRNTVFEARAEEIKMAIYPLKGAPTLFWDVFGQKGHILRGSVHTFGPLLFSRLLNLNTAQEGLLNIAFRYTEDQNRQLRDLTDLKNILNEMIQNLSKISRQYGAMNKTSIGIIQRAILALEEQGGEYFLGEPYLQIDDLMQKTAAGEGIVNILDAQNLMKSPNVYSGILLWLLTQLFEKLPEVGDLDKPKFVLFFDEAHMIFSSAPKILIDRIEQMVRLIRSKGVGVFFVTQSPLDIPEKILAQLGNRIQHALRAYTPKEIQAVKLASRSFRANPNFDTFSVITELSTGEALISNLGEKAIPDIVERTLIRPPSSQIGPISEFGRQEIMRQDFIQAKYDQKFVDKETMSSASTTPTQVAGEDETQQESLKPKAKGYQRQTLSETVTKTLVRSVANKVGRALANGGGQIVQALIKSIFNRKK